VRIRRQMKLMIKGNCLYIERLCLDYRVIALLALGFMTGCGRDDIKVYRVEKENKQPLPSISSEPAQLPPGHPDIGETSLPKLTWNLPSTWQELAPGGMRVGSFVAKGKDGQVADISIIPLSGAAGGVLFNVNRWRGQVGLGDINEQELAKVAQGIEISGQPAQFFEVVGRSQSADSKTNILGAILGRKGTTWFVKMTGVPSVVNEQKPAFLEFLKSLKFQTAPQTAAPASSLPTRDQSVQSTPDTNEDTPKWNIPSGWRQGPPSQFLVGKFLINGEDNSKAAVNVSLAGGGLADNINRWRGQLGLERLPNDEVEKQVQALEVPGGKAMLIDMRGTDATTGRKAWIVGAIVTQSNRTWYYKLMGDEPLVEREKEAFIKFVKSATYP
jgi:hypothetical protein